MEKRRLVFTVTNDLNYDQRMIRICSSLANAGYDVTLIGFERKTSKPLAEKPFKQIRIPIVAEQGKLLYADYWRKLFFKLVSGNYDVMCAIDLDTILPVYFASALKKKKRVYDAHELFTELKEVVTRPAVYKMWTWIEGFAVPKFPVGYTIGPCYADEFRKKYGIHYKVVRNATVLKPFIEPETREPYILYQGWVNEGRCFEELIPAMQHVDMPLVVCGEGNFYKQARELAAQYNVTSKIDFRGYVPPDKLVEFTRHAYIGITLFDATSKSNVLSLANRFFDYMHHGVPQLCMNFPEYQKVNNEYEVASLIDYPTNPEHVAAALNKMIHDKQYHSRMRDNCIKAREKYCWQEEEKTLLSVYKELLADA
jgi:glycosyltransferase involved in cell wall biosynthesis